MAYRILVIDDAEELVQLYKEILCDEGYDVIGFAEVVRDVAVVEELAPNLIILDYLFGQEAAGFMMLQQLRMNRATAAIPVIVVSAATTDIQDVEDDLCSKGIGVVYKPFDIDTLLTEVRAKLDGYTTRERG
jgi:DNA-binding response OmpR family regulator